LAVNCAILSYNGTVYFGFSGDVHAAPDLRRLEKLLMTSFTELRAAVGIEPAERKKVRRKPKVRTGEFVPPKAAPATIPAPDTFVPLEPKRVQPAPTRAREDSLTQMVVA
jgi:hypothetical protein